MEANNFREKQSIKLAHYGETKKIAHDTQIARAKENHNLITVGPIRRTAPGEGFTSGPSLSLRPVPPSLIKKKTIAILIARHADCRRMISMLYPTFFMTFDSLFELITKIRLASLYKLNHHNISASICPVVEDAL